MKANHYYKRNNMLLAVSPQWEVDDYGLTVEEDGTTQWDGRGDAFSKGQEEGLATGDKDLDLGNYRMYRDKVRWLDGPVPSVEGKKPLRDVRSVTRDFIIGLTAYFILSGQPEIVKSMNYPFVTRWYRMTFGLWHWMKFFKTEKERHLRKYERKAIRSIKCGWITEDWRLWLNAKAEQRRLDDKSWKWLDNFSRLFGMPMYVKNLHTTKAYAINSSKVKEAMIEYGGIPEWNYALRVMCNDLLTHADFKAIRDYRCMDGNQWSAEKKLNNGYLVETDEFQLTRDWLWWLMKKEYGEQWRQRIPSWIHVD